MTQPETMGIVKALKNCKQPGLTQLKRNGMYSGMANERKHITQPADWWKAFKAESDKQGISLAEWLGEAGKSQLPKRIAAKLSKRRPANRPRLVEHREVAREGERRLGGKRFL